jgi:hypothetical protein
LSGIRWPAPELIDLELRSGAFFKPLSLRLIFFIPDNFYERDVKQSALKSLIHPGLNPLQAKEAGAF